VVKLLIPTRNRAMSLAGVLSFLQRFYPSTRVIVADGSAEHLKDLNRKAIAGSTRGLRVDYRPYPYEMPYFDRILDVLRQEEDPFIAMGADDDFPMMNVYNRCEKFLAENDGFVTAMGMLVTLTLKSPTDVTTRWLNVRDILSDDPERRAVAYSRWSFPTTYAVTRRQHLIARYERAKTAFLADFYDFTLGVHDATVGKIRAFPQIGTIATRNFNHSYLRYDDKLIFLRRSGEILEIAETMQADLMQHAGVDSDQARFVTERMIRAYIAAFCNSPIWMRLGFGESNLFTNPNIQKQIALMHDLFTKGTKTRRDHDERLEFIFRALNKNATSQDNPDERGTYETLGRQMEAKAPAEGEVSSHWSPTLAPSAIHSDQQSAPMTPKEILQARRILPETLTYAERNK
jgi:glycosyltransferase domain-containing protein